MNYGENSPIHTSALRNCKFPITEGTCEGYLTPNSSEMGVILIQEWWGLNASMQAKSDRLAKDGGFKVLCPDFFDGKVAKNSDEAYHSMQGLKFEKACEIVRDAAQFLMKNGCKKVGVAGFCMGGALTIASLATPVKELSAGVCFYGIPDGTKFPPKNIKVPVLLQFGRNDTYAGFSDPPAAEKLQNEITSNGVSSELHMYEGAAHAFMNPHRPDSYNPEVAEVALKRMIEFFLKHLK